MRIVSLNTWGTRGPWSERLETMRAEFARIDADVIVLQETVLTPELDQAELIFGNGYHLAQHTDRETGRHGALAGQGITTASRWPIGEVVEIDLNVSERTSDFACACLITEVLAPDPLGRIWVANHFPDYQLDHERQRRLQAATVARALEQLVVNKPGHVIVAGDMDADPSSDSMRFWTGRHVVDDTSVCYRNAAEAICCRGHLRWPRTRDVRPLEPFPSRPGLAVSEHRSRARPVRTQRPVVDRALLRASPRHRFHNRQRPLRTRGRLWDRRG